MAGILHLTSCMKATDTVFTAQRHAQHMLYSCTTHSSSHWQGMVMQACALALTTSPCKVCHGPIPLIRQSQCLTHAASTWLRELVPLAPALVTVQAQRCRLNCHCRQCPSWSLPQVLLPHQALARLPDQADGCGGAGLRGASRSMDRRRVL